MVEIEVKNSKFWYDKCRIFRKFVNNTIFKQLIINSIKSHVDKIVNNMQKNVYYLKKKSLVCTNQF